MPVSKPCRVRNCSNRWFGRGIALYSFVASVLFCRSDLSAFVQPPSSDNKSSFGPRHRPLSKESSDDLQEPAHKLIESERPWEQIPASLLATLLLGLVLMAMPSAVLAQKYPLTTDENFFERLGKQFVPLGRALYEKEKDVEGRMERIKSINLAESIVRKAETNTESQLKKIEEQLPQTDKKQAEQLINQIESRKASNPLPETVVNPTDKMIKIEEENAVAILDEVVGDLEKNASPEEKKVLQAIEKDIAKVEKDILPDSQPGIDAAIKSKEAKPGNADDKAAPKADVETTKKETEVTPEAKAAKTQEEKKAKEAPAEAKSAEEEKKVKEATAEAKKADEEKKVKEAKKEEEKKVKEATAEANREEMVLKEEVKTIDKLEELKRTAIAEEKKAEQELQKIAAAINEEIAKLEAQQVPSDQGIAKVEELKNSAITEEQKAEKNLQKIRVAMNEEVAGRVAPKVPAKQETPIPEAAKVNDKGAKDEKKPNDFTFKITFRKLD